MVVCSFYLRGQCKFGNNCRNEHPANPQQAAGSGVSSWNRNTNTSGSSGSNTAVSYIFTLNTVTEDMNKEKPSWPLSSYGPAKYEPTVVTGQDMSMEELRVKAAQAKASGNLNEYVTYEANSIAATEAIYNNIRNNLPQFFEIAKTSSKTKATPDPTTFANGLAFSSTSHFGSTSTMSAFGTPSAFGTSTTSPSAFGTPSAFGLPAKPVTSVFGAPAPVTATTATSAFGAPAGSTSAFGSTTATIPTAFGQSAFGKSGFGQPAFGQSAFGQTSTIPSSTPAVTSAFGQPTFGQSTVPAGAEATTSAFGQPAFGQPSSLIKPATGAFSAFANATSSPFAAAAAAANSNAATSAPGTAAGGSGGGFSAFANTQPTSFASALNNADNANATPAAKSVFGQPAFGQPAPSASTSAFGSGSSATTPSTFGSGAGTTPSTFGSPHRTSKSLFGQFTQQAAPSSFGQSTTQSAFGEPSAFGQPPQQPSSFSAFGTPQNAVLTTTTASAFGSAPSNTSIASGAGKKAVPDFANAVYNYRPNLIPHDSKLPPNYMELLPEETLVAFRALKFEWGKVPMWVPPVEVRVKNVGEALFS